jgi:hypothetical protein
MRQHAGGRRNPQERFTCNAAADRSIQSDGHKDARIDGIISSDQHLLQELPITRLIELFPGRVDSRLLQRIRRRPPAPTIICAVETVEEVLGEGDSG